MLLTTPENTRWRRRAWVVLLLLIGSYVWYASHEYPHGGSPIGLTYGTLGVFLIVLLMLYGIRKRSYKNRWGMLQTWLHVHIYLGLLVLVVILFHSGFRFHDTMAVTALVLLTVVVVSGILVVRLYSLVPPLHVNVDSNLTLSEMSDQMNTLAQSMARLATGKSEAFQAVYSSLIQAEQPAFLAGWRLLVGRYRKRRLGKNMGAALEMELAKVAPQEETDLQWLLELGNQMREMHTRLTQKQRYRNLLEAWLYLHIPLSFALILAVIVHVIAAFYYW